MQGGSAEVKGAYKVKFRNLTLVDVQELRVQTENENVEFDLQFALNNVNPLKKPAHGYLFIIICSAMLWHRYNIIILMYIYVAVGDFLLLVNSNNCTDLDSRQLLLGFYFFRF